MVLPLSWPSLDQGRMLQSGHIGAAPVPDPGTRRRDDDMARRDRERDPSAAGIPALRILKGSAVAAACSIVAACSSAPEKTSSKYGVSASRRVYADGETIPKGGGRDQVGKPYTIGGRTYVPREDPSYDRKGIASWYGSDFHGRLTANGEIYDRRALSAAHTTMPLPSYARVTNLQNGKSLIVRVNDRGPYVGNREIDLSERAAELLEFKGRGLTDIRVQYVGRAPVSGSDDRFLAATLTDGERPSIEADRVMIASAGGRAPSPQPAPRPTLVADASSAVGTGWRSEVPGTGMAPVARSPYERPPVAVDPVYRPAPYGKPASTSADSILGEAGEADGAPVSIVPPGHRAVPASGGALPAGAMPAPSGMPAPGTIPFRVEPAPPGDVYRRPPANRGFEPFRTSFAPEGDRVDAAFAAVGAGQGNGLKAGDPTVTGSVRAAERVRIDLGAYADAGNAARLAGVMGRFGSVATGTVTQAGGRRVTVVSLETGVHDRDRAISAARAAGVSEPRVVSP